MEWFDTESEAILFNMCKNEERNAGAKSLAKLVLTDNGSGVMSPGPCADLLSEWRRMKSISADLLAACEDALAWLKEEGDQLRSEPMSVLRAAIAKAKGDA